MIRAGIAASPLGLRPRAVPSMLFAGETTLGIWSGSRYIRQRCQNGKTREHVIAEG